MEMGGAYLEEGAVKSSFPKDTVTSVLVNDWWEKFRFGQITSY